MHSCGTDDHSSMDLARHRSTSRTSGLSRTVDRKKAPLKSMIKGWIQTATGLGQSSATDEEEITEFERGRAGIGSCTPDGIQCLSNIWVFTLLYSHYAIWSTALDPFLRSQITHMERHLGVNTYAMGIAHISDDIGYVVTVLPCARYGMHMNIPRFLAVTGVLFSLATISLGMGEWMMRAENPHFGSSAAPFNISNVHDNSVYLCTAVTPGVERQEALLDMDTGGYIFSFQASWLYYHFVLVMFLVGAFKSGRVSLLMFFIENNVTVRSNSGILIGILFTGFIFSSPIALFLGSLTSAIPVDLKESRFDVLDPRFIGAWWLGCLFIGVVSFLSALPLFLVPRAIIVIKQLSIIVEPPEMGSQIQHDPSGSDRPLSDDTSPRKPSQQPTTMSNSTDRGSMVESMSRIFREPVVILLIVETFFLRLCGTGFLQFDQIFIEKEFNKSPSEVSLMLGASQFITATLGMFSGGFLVTRYRMDRNRMLLFSLLVSLVFACSGTALLMLYCDNETVVGVTERRNNASCSCNSDNNLLVCGSDGVNYVSPCVAGCRNSSGQDFIQCDAIDLGLGHVSPGICKTECTAFWPFMYAYMVIVFTASAGVSPRLLAVTRSVRKEDQTLVIAMYHATGTLIGGIPAPIVFARIIDGACILTYSKGNTCALYDLGRLKNGFIGTFVVVSWIAVTCLTLCTVIASHEDNKAKDEDKDDDAVLTRHHDDVVATKKNESNDQDAALNRDFADDKYKTQGNASPSSI